MIRMKRTSLYLALAALAVCGCAKDPVAGLNDSAKLYFDSWIHVNYPNAPKTALGVYTLDETPGTGAQAGSAETTPYVRVEYVVRDLAGRIGSTSSEELCKQLGEYVVNDYYGPEVWARGENVLSAGVDDALSTMQVGGTKRFVIPGWLQTTSRYATEKEYLENVSGSSPAIYEVKLLELISDIKKWETDSIGRYVSRNFPGKSVRDSLKYGFYYFESKAPMEGQRFSSDTTIYINYVGRLLNGTIFDTNVKDTAKFYGIYSASRTYGPSSVTISKEDDELTVKMGSSSVIDGFQETILQMGPYAKGISVFYSTIGYGTSGSGSSIPAYAPLRFDIEVVNKS